MIGWMKVDGSARWTDATIRYAAPHMKSAVDSNTYLVMGRSTTNHAVMWRRRYASGNANEELYTFSGSGTTGWFAMGYSWDINVPRLKGYFYVPGEVGFHEVFSIAGTDFTAWNKSSHPVENNNTVIFAGSTSSQEWIGSAAHLALWCGKALTEAQFHQVMVP